MKTFFTSDTHFGHKRIVELSKRPFPNLGTMEDEIIRRWNARVSANDQVFHLGDFSFGNRAFQTKVLSSLSGRIVLVRGNHDRGTKSLKEMGFYAVVDETEYLDPASGQLWYLAHKPWWQNRPGAVIGPRRQLCGHVHNDWLRLQSPHGFGFGDEYDIINVGADVWDFTPRTFEELILAPAKLMPLEKAMAIPHHGEM
jgi:calcineurin-like phosphoesterase family protein